MKKIIGTIILLFAAASASAMEVSLSWDRNADASYYIVHWGEAPGEYSGNSDQITATSYKAVLPGCKRYYFAVKAFNECGNSSDYSDEVYNDIPTDKPGVVKNCVINSVGL